MKNTISGYADIHDFKAQIAGIPLLSGMDRGTLVRVKGPDEKAIAKASVFGINTPYLCIRSYSKCKGSPWNL